MKEKEIEKHLVQLQKVLHRYARSLTCDQDNAWDLLQETNLKTLEQREKFKEGTDFRAWALTVMHNLFINKWKKSARMFFAPDMEEIRRSMTVEPGYDPAERYEIREQVAYGVRLLSREDRKVWKMRRDGYHYEEIAQETGMPLGTVKSKINSIRKKLQKVM